MPRRSCESAMASAMRRLARRNAAFRRLPSRLMRGLERERPGAVLVGAGGLVDEGLDGLDGDARGDFAGDVPAHAVGDDEEAEVRTGRSSCPRCWFAGDRGPSVTAQRTKAASGVMAGVSLCGPQPLQLAGPRATPMRDDTWRRASDFSQRDARALEVDVATAAAASRSSARLRAASARSTSISSARSASCARIVTRSGSTSAKPNAIDR